MIYHRSNHSFFECRKVPLSNETDEKIYLGIQCEKQGQAPFVLTVVISKSSVIQPVKEQKNFIDFLSQNTFSCTRCQVWQRHVSVSINVLSCHWSLSQMKMKTAMLQRPCLKRAVDGSQGISHF